MAALTISLSSPKGGTGKTAIAASLGVLIASLGKKVLLIDADRATSGLTLLMLKRLADVEGFESVVGLFDGPPPRPVQVAAGLMFVPASSRMSAIPSPDFDHSNEQQRLTDLFSDLKAGYDVVIIDTEPGTEEFTRSVITAADRAVIVSEFDPMSASGVERLKATFQQAWPLGHTYVLVNKLLPELAKIESNYFTAFDHLPPIPFDFEVMRRYSRGEIPFDPASPGSFVQAVVRMARELMPEYRQDMEAWLEKQADVLKRPLRTQLDELGVRIIDVQEALVSIRTRPFFVGQVARLTPMAAALAGISYLSAGGALALFLDDMIGYALMAVGVASLVVTPLLSFYWRDRYRIRTAEARERAAIEARNLERDLDRLTHERAELESLLATESEDYLSRST